MKFEDTTVVDADGEVAWGMISNPETLYDSIPGAREINKNSKTEYTGIISRRVAGASITLDSELYIIEKVPPKRLVAEISGSDRKNNGRMEAEAEVRINQQEDDTVLIHYSIEMIFTGRLSELGSRIVKRKVKSDIDTLFQNLSNQVSEY